MTAPAPVRCYECTVKGKDWHRLVGNGYGIHYRLVHAFSPGKAKYEYWRDVREAWPDVPFTMVRVVSVGAPTTDEPFRLTAAYRGVPFARVGMLVKVGDWWGRIVGNNASANFDVAFLDGPYEGQTLNCHPRSQMRFFDEKGDEIAI